MLLMKSLKNRQSSRSFSSRELPMEMISDILWAAFGINRPESGKRTAPSAMNMQEIDIYVAMKSGLYLYDSRENILSPVLERDIREFTGKQDFTQEAPLDLIYVADFSRMKGDEASKIFYSAVDVGFISQNVYLFCASKGLATVILGWVDKPALEKIMNLKDSQKVILT
ncbi:MAG: SagB/ThcOx family dehydrogenase, partial [Candidatus Omnitrophica bacterium]|nr:SagB/ThcOx family dehydrogenase [Candidatus Omnitrophota bacterium]